MAARVHVSHQRTPGAAATRKSSALNSRAVHPQLQEPIGVHTLGPVGSGPYASEEQRAEVNAELDKFFSKRRTSFAEVHEQRRSMPTIASVIESAKADAVKERAKGIIKNGIHYSRASKVGCITVDPRTDNHKKWDIYIALLLVYTAYVTPYEVAFLETKLNPLFVINFIVNISFFADMVKSFFTAIQDLEQQLWVGDWDRIVSSYLKGWFTIDLISILPFDSVGLFIGSDAMSKFKGARLIRLLRLLKLLRLLRSMRIINRWQDAFGFTFAFKSLIKFILVVITGTHWMAVVLRLIPEMIPYTATSSVVDANGEVTEQEYDVNWMHASTLTDQPIAEASPSRQYNRALYWATMTLTTIGYGDVTATNDAESVYMTLCMLLSSFVYAYAIGEVCGIVATMDEASKEFNRQSDMLNNFCSENEIPRELTMRLREYFRHYKDVHRNNFYKSLLGIMSPGLRGEVSVEMNSVLAEGIGFFNAADLNERARFLAELTATMSTRLYGAQEVVIAYGSRMEGVYLVRSGIACATVLPGVRCGVTSGQIFSVGTWFGIEGLLKTGRYQYQVRTLNILRVEMIMKAELDGILWSGDFIETQKLIRKAYLKLVFRERVIRAMAIVKPQQMEAARRGSVGSAKLTKEQAREIKYGGVPEEQIEEQEQAETEGNLKLADVMAAVQQLATSVADIQRRMVDNELGKATGGGREVSNKVLARLDAIQAKQDQIIKWSNSNPLSPTQASLRPFVGPPRNLVPDKTR